MKIKFKLLLLGILSTVLVFVSLPSTNLITEKAYADNGKGSTIAGVNVSGMKEKEIKQSLNEAIESWKSEQVIITDGSKTLEIDPSNIQFDVDATISEYESLVDKPWYAFWKKRNVVHIPLHVQPNEELKNEIAKFSIWKTEETYNQLLNVSSYLKGHEVEAQVQDITVYENERLSVVVEKIPNDNVEGVKEFVEVINNYLVNPEETFSFLEVIKEKIGSVDSETLNFVASLLYSAVLETEYQIIERHQQSTLPSYVDPGKEAQISLESNEDLRFLNSSGNVALIKATVEGGKLKIEIYSDVKGKNVKVTVEEEVIKPRVITRYSRKLAIGQSKLVQSGAEGLRVNVYRTVTGDGDTIDDRISRSYYPPKNRIVLKSARTIPVSTDVDGNVTPTENADLNGDGLPDVEQEETVGGPTKDENLAPGSYYDKGGNLITP